MSGWNSWSSAHWSFVSQGIIVKEVVTGDLTVRWQRWKESRISAVGKWATCYIWRQSGVIHHGGFTLRYQRRKTYHHEAIQSFFLGQNCILLSQHQQLPGASTVYTAFVFFFIFKDKYIEWFLYLCVWGSSLVLNIFAFFHMYPNIVCILVLLLMYFKLFCEFYFF